MTLNISGQINFEKISYKRFQDIWMWKKNYIQYLGHCVAHSVYPVASEKTIKNILSFFFNLKNCKKYFVRKKILITYGRLLPINIDRKNTDADVGKFDEKTMIGCMGQESF